MNRFASQATTPAVIAVESRLMPGLEFMLGPSIGGTFFAALNPMNTPKPFFKSTDEPSPNGFLLRGRCIRRVFA
jgi:hypothetical protein